MELTGIEPAPSSVQGKRSPDCTTAPYLVSVTTQVLFDYLEPNTFEKKPFLAFLPFFPIFLPFFFFFFLISSMLVNSICEALAFGTAPKYIIKERIPVSIDFIILLRQRVKHNLSLLYIKYH